MRLWGQLMSVYADVWGYVVAVVGSGAASSAVTGLFMRRKTSADAASMLSDAALELVQGLRAELENYKAEVSQLRERVRELETELAVLRARGVGSDG